MLRVKGWSHFQHYKDRRPPWLKLHRELIDNIDWHSLSHASKALAICIWIVACEHEDPAAGLVTDDARKLAFRARMDEKEVIKCVKELIQYGFLEHLETSASDLLAPCYQSATTETETETEDIKEAKPKKDKTSLKELSVEHIEKWLSDKRANGKYLTIDEHELLEMFKDYCASKNKSYSDYVAAYRNAFKWHNAPTKGQNNAENRRGRGSGSKSDAAKAAIMRGID